MKSRNFSMPVWLGLILALNFPYYGLLMSKWGFLALLVLSFLNLFFFDFRSVWRERMELKSCLFYYILGFVLFPCLQLGVLMAAVAPVAIVAPQFLSQAQSRAALYILLSTLLYPFVSLGYLAALGFAGSGIQIWPLFRDSLLLTCLPVLISMLMEFIAPDPKLELGKRLKRFLPVTNMTLIGFLVFIYFGSAFAKTQLTDLNWSVLLSLMLLGFLQDFGVFWFLHWLKAPRCEQICFSMKNVALSGGVLLVYQPQAVLACSVVFVAHALLFSFLSVGDSRQKINPQIKI